MRLAPVLLSVSLLAAPAAGLSAELQFSPDYQRCLASPSGQGSSGVVVGVIECANAELKVQEARLNRAYRDALQRRTQPRQRVALQKAQRAWIAFRDADCASRYDPDWGSMTRVDEVACRLDHTARRADALETR